MNNGYAEIVMKTEPPAKLDKLCFPDPINPAFG